MGKPKFKPRTQICTPSPSFCQKYRNPELRTLPSQRRSLGAAGGWGGLPRRSCPRPAPPLPAPPRPSPPPIRERQGRAAGARAPAGSWSRERVRRCDAARRGANESLGSPSPPSPRHLLLPAAGPELCDPGSSGAIAVWDKQ